jgi:hypothetical protein
MGKILPTSAEPVGRQCQAVTVVIAATRDRHVAATTRHNEARNDRIVAGRRRCGHHHVLGVAFLDQHPGDNQ